MQASCQAGVRVRDINRILFVLGYLLFVGPPRAIDLAISERKKGGELAKLPVLAVLIVEALVRASTLLFAAVALEQIISVYWYSWLRIDRSALVMLIVGSIHMFSYYLFIYHYRKRLGQQGFRLYRLFRNLSYALLPGLVVVTLLLLVDGLRSTPWFSEELQLAVYAGVSLFMIGVGLIEFMIVSRVPQGLDTALRR